MMKNMRSEDLRDYQLTVVGSILSSFAQGNKRVVMCLPTGGGKTRIFTYMVKRHLDKGGRVLVITDRVELLKQAGGSFDSFGINPEMITAGSSPDLTLPCHVAMIETLSRRAEDYATFIASRSMVILDECHKAAFDKIFPYFGKDTFVIGATATPYRTGKQPSLDQFYTDIIQVIDTPELIKKGFLSDAETYGLPIDLTGIKKVAGEYDPKAMANRYEERKVYEGVIENYNRICPNTKTLAFASNIESCKSLCDKMLQSGLNARHLDSNMTDYDRREILDWFKTVKDGILCSVGILTTGFDQPDVETIILYRATTSLPLFLQMVGRGSRTTKTKGKFTILDFGNNVKTHDFWEANRTWTLHKVDKKKKDVAPIKSCPKCNAMIPKQTVKCNYCGHTFKKTPKEEQVEEIAMLIKLPKKERLKIANRSDIRLKAEMAKSKVISPFWVLHNMENKQDAIEFCNLMGYKKGFIYHNKERFKVFQQ